MIFADRDSDGLASAGVVITRPADSSRSMIERVRASGGVAIRLPGIALRIASDTPKVARALRDAARADWVFSSPASVRFAFHLAPSLRIGSRAHVFAVGAGTALALARHRVRATAPSRADSEGLLALAELADLRGRRIALIGAPGGRDLIAPTLRRRGAEVETIHVYERVPPRLTRRHFDALALAADPLVMLVSSGEALRNLSVLLPLPLLARLRRQPLVVSSDRLAGIARGYGFTDIVEAASALTDDLLDGARRALARHRL